MSRVGKQPIDIPQGVDVQIEGRTVTTKGPKGELSKTFRGEFSIEKKDNQIIVTPAKDADSKEVKSMWGLTRSLIANMIQGVAEGYGKKLELEGIGFRAVVEGDTLVLNIGFSHPVKIKTLEGVQLQVDKNVISVSGIDKEKVGELAAQIRASKPAEPYKGKGFKYEGEVIRRKLGKKAVGTTG